MSRAKATWIVLGAFLLLFLSACDRDRPEEPPVPAPPPLQSL